MTEREIEARLRLLPPIRRARDWRLHCQDGRRILDLWQDGGRGILGARAKGLGSAIKASIDRGLDRPLPSHFEARLQKAVLARWPWARALRLYHDEGEALAVIARLSGHEEQGESLLGSTLVHDPARRPVAMAEKEPASALLLRPFAKWLDPSASFGLALPLLPLSRGLGPTLLLFADAETAKSAGVGRLIPPLLLASAIGALESLAKYESGMGESHWARIDRRLSHLFQRRGPWLFARQGGLAYDHLFEEALRLGILLSPDPDLPSLIPGDFDDGEVAPLARLRLEENSP